MLTEPGALGLAAGTPEDAGPAGFAIVRAVGDEAEILTLAVSPQYRRRGLGRTLVAAILAHGSARGCARIFLEVAEDNRAAHDLYHGQGFELVGRRAGYYRRAGGPGIDAMVLSCRLGVGSADSI
ncbi:Ribosomal-protein-S18p-alanine acetyltransferase [hydrothermal vent metagenome]|uniref:Ribosomal-protein-S18p-alanine acetyltransferase n=1 Tax=hydrothermal vent metagenome TaxID=652676 RepID=A0A3B0TBV3_9ZZZZ